MTEKEKHIFNMQSLSTQRAMMRSDKEREEYWLSSLPKEAIAKPEAKSIEEATGTRPLSFQEANLFLETRTQRASNFHASQAGRFSKLPANTRVPAHIGGALKGSVDAHKRSSGIAAFMHVKSRFKDLMKSWGLIKETVTERVRREAGIDEK